MNQLHRIHASGSQDRLDRLIQERLEPGVDKARIDQRIWDLFGEDWCVMFTDLSGFSRDVEKFGIIHFLQIIFESHRIFTPVIEEHDGVLLKSEGDSLLVIFRNVQKALRAAQSMQDVSARYNRERAPEEQILLCIGLGHGRCLRIGDTDVFGMEVNAACKLGEDVAKSGEIIITGTVRELLGGIEGISLEPVQGLPSGISKAFRVVAK